MDKLPASMKTVREELSKQPSEQWREGVVKLLAKCGLHFRQELSDPDYEIFLSALRDTPLWRISVALDRCLNECEFMPKLADVWRLMPEAQDHPRIRCPELPGEEWTERLENMVLHYKGDPKGYKVVTKMEKIDRGVA